MKTTRLLTLCLALGATMQFAHAGDVRLYRADETPDPRDVAAILSRDASPSPAIKFRSIRLTSDQATAEADKPDGLALPVQFAFDSATIMPDAKRQLDAVASGIKLANGGTEVVIEGHTDAVGSRQYNEGLSLRRANAVKAYLVQQHGIAPQRLRPVGAGMDHPYNTANPFAAENRRVEFRAGPSGA